MELVDPEIHQLFITKGISDFLISNAKRTRQYRKNLIFEIHNCIERFLIHLSNKNIDYEYSSGVKTKFKIYSIVQIEPTSIKDGLKQFALELVQKKIIKPSNIKAVIKKVIDIILFNINKEVKECKDCQVSFKEVNGIISYKTSTESNSKTIISINIKNFRNIEDIAKKNNIKDAFVLSLRYASFITGGNHWSIPKKYYNYLYYNCGVRNEGFASIINTKALLHPDSKFCSIFPDLEGKYGSLGSFFHISIEDHSGNWIINPPYTEEIINRTIDKLLDQMGSLKTAKAFFVILPNWMDNDSINNLLHSKYTLKSIVIKPGEMFFETQNQSAYITKTEQIYCVIYNKIGRDSECDKILVDGLDKIKRIKPKGTSTSIIGSLYFNTTIIWGD